MPKCKIIIAVSFEKELKRLAKRYPSITSDLSALLPILEDNPTEGIPLGGGLYKIRLSIKSKGKGKSGGARIISYYLSKGSEVFLLTIFDKSEQENISEKKIKQLLLAALEDRDI